MGERSERSARVVPGSWASGLNAADLRGPRETALWVVERCLGLRQPVDALRVAAEARLDDRDRALSHRLTTEVLRWLVRLDDVIAQAGRRAIREIDPRLLGPLRLGAAQLLFLDRVPAHAAVSTSVDLAGRRTRAGARFVNALLRKISTAEDLGSFPVRRRDSRERLAVETSHSRFLVDRWIERFGEERARAILEANNADRPASLLALTGAAGREPLMRRLERDGVVTRESVLSPLGLLVETGRIERTESFARGEVYPQDEASQCAALIPPPRPGERVLDAASSPGGKTLCTLAWERGARVVAADGGLRRLGRLLENRRRTGSEFAVLATDARRPGLRRPFDRVIADLPCTGSGTLRKHPELKWRIDASEVARLSAVASEMLDGLAPLVARGGLLVVATCSLEREENEDQVAAFLRRHGEFELTALEGRLLPQMTGGIEAHGRWRLFPEAGHDGFTVHLLERTG